MKGYIQGQKINGELQLDDVEGKQGISFPDTSSGDSSLFTNLLGSKIEGVVNQLNNGVQDARNNIGQFGNDLQTTKSSLIAIGESIYLTYFIALNGIGFGLLAIIIAVFSLSRRLPCRGILTTTVSFQIS